MKLGFIDKKTVINPQLHDRARRHTKRVKWLRLFVPGGISGLLALLMYEFGWYEDFKPQPLASSSYAGVNLENQLINSTLISRDNKGKPVTIKAKKTVQSSGQAHLEKPESHMELEKGYKIQITSDHANYHEEEKTLDYHKDVTLKTADGMIIETDQARVDLESRVAQSSHRVIGEGPQGKLEGEGFEWRENTLSLRGKSALTLN